MSNDKTNTIKFSNHNIPRVLLCNGATWQDVPQNIHCHQQLSINNMNQSSSYDAIFLIDFCKSQVYLNPLVTGFNKVIFICKIPNDILSIRGWCCSKQKKVIWKRGII